MYWFLLTLNHNEQGKKAESKPPPITTMAVVVSGGSPLHRWWWCIVLLMILTQGERTEHKERVLTYKWHQKHKEKEPNTLSTSPSFSVQKSGQKPFLPASNNFRQQVFPAARSNRRNQFRSSVSLLDRGNTAASNSFLTCLIPSLSLSGGPLPLLGVQGSSRN